MPDKTADADLDPGAASCLEVRNGTGISDQISLSLLET